MVGQLDLTGDKDKADSSCGEKDWRGLLLLVAMGGVSDVGSPTHWAHIRSL